MNGGQLKLVKSNNVLTSIKDVSFCYLISFNTKMKFVKSGKKLYQITFFFCVNDISWAMGMKFYMFSG